MDKYDTRNDKIFMDVIKSENRDRLPPKNNKVVTAQYNDKFMAKVSKDKDKFMNKVDKDNHKFMNKVDKDNNKFMDKVDKDKFMNKVDKDNHKFMNNVILRSHNDKFMINNKNQRDNFDEVPSIPLVSSHGGSYKNKSVTYSEILYREKYIKYKNKYLNLRKNIK